MAAGRRALQIADALEDDALRDLAYRYLGRSYHAMGDYPRAIEALTRAGRARSRRGTRSPILSPEIFLVFCLSETGGFAEGIAQGTALLRAAEDNQQPVNLTAACAAVGRLYLRKGNLEASIALLERGVGLSERASIPLLFPLTAAALGAAYTQVGRATEGLPLLEQAVNRAMTMGRMVDQALWVAWLSEALFRADRVEEAIAQAHRAQDLAVAHQERPHHAWALRILAEIYAERDHEQAEEHFGRALVLADELGMRPLRAHCHLGLGLLYERLGLGRRAGASLVEACGLFREMEMTSWLGKAEAVRTRAAAEPGTSQ